MHCYTRQSSRQTQRTLRAPAGCAVRLQGCTFHPALNTRKGDQGRAMLLTQMLTSHDPATYMREWDLRTLAGVASQGSSPRTNQAAASGPSQVPSGAQPATLAGHSQPQGQPQLALQGQIPPQAQPSYGITTSQGLPHGLSPDAVHSSGVPAMGSATQMRAQPSLPVAGQQGSGSVAGQGQAGPAVGVLQQGSGSTARPGQAGLAVGGLQQGPMMASKAAPGSKPQAPLVPATQSRAEPAVRAQQAEPSSKGGMMVVPGRKWRS